MAQQNHFKASQSQTGAHFDKIAAEYESSTGNTTRVVAAHVAELLSPIAANSSILDNASGTGIMVERLLAANPDPQITSTLDVTCVDASPAMINLLKSKAESWPISSSQLHASAISAEDLKTLGSESFDYSFTIFGIMFFPQPQPAAAELYRTLKPGGTAVVTTWSDLGYLDAISMAAKSMGKAVPKFPIADEWFSASHLAKICEEAGFVDVNVHQFDSTYTAESVSDMSHTLAGAFATLLGMQNWTEDEVKRLAKEMVKAFEEYPPEVLKVQEGESKLRMVAHVAVCKK
jgi:ubiquinone/menaquinone biosynthesis C-methylase UbiE